MDWQPIETAPRDGTLFDVWSGYRVTNLWFATNGKLYREGHSHPADLEHWPTHWMPLPAPPPSRITTNEGEIG
jgi:hypothetical protein